MLSFQRLDVYQRAIEFLALVYDVVSDNPRGADSVPFHAPHTRTPTGSAIQGALIYAPPPMWLGIFAGGKARRMGGAQKGLLPAPDTGEPLVARLARLGRDIGLQPIIVGAADLGTVAADLPHVLDAEPAVGPLSGLAALIAHAGDEPVIAVGCDMPHVSAALLSRVAHEAPGAAVLAPRDPATGKWHPLCARYDPTRVRPVLSHALATGARSFQALFRQLSVVELALSDAERGELEDWDTPEDLRRPDV